MCDMAADSILQKPAGGRFGDGRSGTSELKRGGWAVPSVARHGDETPICDHPSHPDGQPELPETGHLTQNYGIISIYRLGSCSEVLCFVREGEDVWASV